MVDSQVKSLAATEAIFGGFSSGTVYPFKIVSANNTIVALIQSATNGGAVYLRNSTGTNRIILDGANGNSAFSSSSASGNTSAVLACQSTTTGFLPPVMTEAQMQAIGTPSTGLVVFNSTSGALCFYTGSVWQLV